MLFVRDVDNNLKQRWLTNKNRSRTAIISVNGAQNKMERMFNKSDLKIAQKRQWTSRQRSPPKNQADGLQIFMGLKIKKIKLLTGRIRLFSLSISQFMGQNHCSLYLITLWKSNTVNSDFDRNIKCVVFEKGKLENQDILFFFSISPFFVSQIPILM